MDDNRFESRLGQRLRAYEAHIPDDEPRRRPGSSSSRSRRVAAWGTAAAGILAGAALALVLANRPDTPVGDSDATHSAFPTATPTATPGAVESSTVEPTVAPPRATASPTASPAPAPRNGWTAVRVADEGPYVAVNGVGEWGDGLMAYGRSEGVAGAIWLSTDGEIWAPAEVPESPPGTAVFVNDVARMDDGYLAVGTLGHPEGSGPMGSVIWSSTDGRTWSEVEGSAAVRDVPLFTLAAVGRTVVAGGLGGVWLSGDGGSTWSEAPAPNAEDWNVSNVMAHDAGFVAAGFIGSAYGPKTAAIWTSVEGDAWTRSDLDAQSATAVAILPDGRLLAVGEADNQLRAWMSDTGQEWTAAPVDATCCITDLASTPTGVVGVGFAPAPCDPASVPCEAGGTVVATTDGATWSSETGIAGSLSSVIYSDRFGVVAAGADVEEAPAVVFGPHPYP